MDEIVLVDNASPDDTLAIARRVAPRARVIERSSNDGFAVASNEGCAAAAGDLLLLINPDVTIDRSALDALIAFSIERPNAVLGPRVQFEDGTVAPTRSGPPGLWNLLGEQVLVRESARTGGLAGRLWPRWREYGSIDCSNLLSGVCLLIPRPVWLDVGGFDESYFMYWEEIDWQLRARALGHPTCLVPAATIVHKRAASSAPLDPHRAELLFGSAARFIRSHFGAKKRIGLALLALGQLGRVCAWSLPPLRNRPEAGARRSFHHRALAAIRRR